MGSRPQKEKTNHLLPLWMRWCIILFVFLVVLGGTALWIVQGAHAIVPLAILTALGTLIGFFQLHPLLFPVLARKSASEAKSALPTSQIAGGANLQSAPPVSVDATLSPNVSTAPTPEILPSQEDAPLSFFPKVNWGKAPRSGSFYGRGEELIELGKWLLDDHCKIVALLGMGGIGKTSLAVALVEQVKGSFSRISWHMLQNAPPLKDVLQDCIPFISDQQRTGLPVNEDDQIDLLIECLQERRCLVVLDNLESVLQAGNRVGQYREGYEGYRKFLQRIGEAKHQSCLLLTSREKPKEVAVQEGIAAPVRSHLVDGLKYIEGREILKDKSLYGGEEDCKVFIERYIGNPLALKIVSQFIHEIFQGDISSFLKNGEFIFSDVRDVLDQQFWRMTALEQEIMYWLAIEREATSLRDLHQYFIHFVVKRELQGALQSLRQRNLVETSAQGFTLQNVIMEYVTNRLVDYMVDELRTETMLLFQRYALIKAQAKDYVRESQVRLILTPILEHLLKDLYKEGLEKKLKHILTLAGKTNSSTPDYIAGNVLNLLVQLGSELRGCDVSGLMVRHAYLRGVALPEVNFARSDLKTSVFTDSFDSILSVAFSPNSKMMATGTITGEILIWQTEDNALVRTLDEHIGWVRSLAFSPDCSLIASGGNDHAIRLWDISSDNCLHTLRGHANQVASVAFSPDGKLLATGSHDHSIHLWEIHNGICIRVLQAHTHRVKSVAFNPDGTLIASGGDDQTIRLWEVETGRCIRVLQGHSNGVKSVAFNPDGTLIASGGDDQTIRLWEVETGRCIRVLQGHTGRVQSIAVNPSGNLLASGSHDKMIRLWEVSSGDCLYTMQGHSQAIWSVAFNPDGTLIASGGDDQTIRLWEVETGRCIRVLQGHTGRVQSIAVNPGCTLIASGGDDQTIRLWEVETGRCIRTLRGHSQWIWSVAFSPDGTMLASGSGDQTIRLWEVETGRCIRTLRGHSKWVRSVAFSPDGTMLASGSGDQTIRLWEVETGRCIRVLQGHTHALLSVAFNSRGDILASGGEDQTTRLWESSTGNSIRILPDNTSRVDSIAFSPEGKIVASANEDWNIYLRDLITGHCLYTLRGHKNAINSIAFSQDGTLLASGSDDETVRLWEIGTSRCLHELKGHTSRISSVAIHGEVIVSSSDDETIKVWGARTGKCLKTMRIERPYEGMNIAQVMGLTTTQIKSLKRLGAVEFS